MTGSNPPFVNLAPGWQPHVRHLHKHGGDASLRYSRSTSVGTRMTAPLRSPPCTAIVVLRRFPHQHFHRLRQITTGPPAARDPPPWTWTPQLREILPVRSWGSRMNLTGCGGRCHRVRIVPRNRGPPAMKLPQSHVSDCRCFHGVVLACCLRWHGPPTRGGVSLAPAVGEMGQGGLWVQPPPYSPSCCSSDTATNRRPLYTLRSEPPLDSELRRRAVDSETNCSPDRPAAT